MQAVILSTYAAALIKWGAVLGFGFTLWIAVALSVAVKVGKLVYLSRKHGGLRRVVA